MRKRIWLTVTLLVLHTLLSLFAAYVPPALAGAQVGGFRIVLHYSGGPPGWVLVQHLLIESGCSGGQCSSTWRPGTQEGLFEKIGDRTHRNQGEGDDNPPGPPPSVADVREQCASGLWAAGDWYHNAIWLSTWSGGSLDLSTDPPTLHFYETYTTMSWEGWNFGEDDECLRNSGTPTPMPTPTPQDPNDPLRCPDPRVVEPPITIATNWRPPNPVVVGQDPDRQGIEFVINAQVPPVEYYWWERVQGKVCRPGVDWRGYPTCSYNGGDGHWEMADEDCQGGRADDPRLRCTKDDGTQGTRVPFCTEHIYRYRDGVDSVRVIADLSQGSINWINGELAARYPGATVRHPHWDVSAPGAIFGSGGSFFSGVVRVPVEDPGWYDTRVIVRTTGTAVSGPRTAEWNGRAPAYLKETTIIK
ncbi:MAG TPA: hypothetical protein VJ793_11350 [Anaerolineae bacterium]|nr:hypothetical protein [Anaerolineae bacterium]